MGLNTNKGDNACSRAGCENPVFVTHAGAGSGTHKGQGLALCAKHYRQWQRERWGPCTVEGCSNLSSGNGLCPMHTRRLKIKGEVGPAEKGKPGSPTRGVDDHLPAWERRKRQRFIDKPRNGRERWMVFAPDHANANHMGYVSEHRYVMSQILGRGLLPGENIHHRNGDTLDNRPENLELWVVSQPAGQRPCDLVAWARTILDRYECHVMDDGPGGAE